MKLRGIAIAVCVGLLAALVPVLALSASAGPPIVEDLELDPSNWDEIDLGGLPTGASRGCNGLLSDIAAHVNKSRFSTFTAASYPGDLWAWAQLKMMLWQYRDGGCNKVVGMPVL